MRFIENNKNYHFNNPLIFYDIKENLSSARNRVAGSSGYLLSKAKQNLYQARTPRTLVKSNLVPIVEVDTVFAPVFKDNFIFLGNSLGFISIGIYFLWLLIGAIFYHYYNDFTWPTALYYAIEAGLSIGFCDPSEPNDSSRAFTIIFVLLGSTVVSGSICIFAMKVLDRKSSKFISSLELDTLEVSNLFT